jgi:hypothetical protein
MFGGLNQDEHELVPCMWRRLTLDAARAASQRLTASDLFPGQGQGSRPNVAMDIFMAPWVDVEHGRIDKRDFWTSQYWGTGLISPAAALDDLHLAPGARESAALSSLKIEEIEKVFRHPDAVTILYRSVPDKDGGMEGIIYAVLPDYVKFKELLVASKAYCSRTPFHHVSVAGWHRQCHTYVQPNVGSFEQTYMAVGFVCD